MAAAFSPEERERIQNQLMQDALEAIAMESTRQMTVKELARRADISKGAFYHFYPGKEHLLLAALEEVHRQMYGRAEKELERQDVDIHQRIRQALREVLRLAERYHTAAFLLNEFPLLIKRMSPAVVQQHYTSDEEHIRSLLQKAGVGLRTDVETLCATLRLLLLSQLVQKETGLHYGQAVELLLDGLCDRTLA